MSIIGKLDAAWEGKPYNPQNDFHYMNLIREYIPSIIAFAIIFGILLYAILCVGYCNHAPEHYNAIANIMKPVSNPKIIFII